MKIRQPSTHIEKSTQAEVSSRGGNCLSAKVFSAATFVARTAIFLSFTPVARPVQCEPKSLHLESWHMHTADCKPSSNQVVQAPKAAQHAWMATQPTPTWIVGTAHVSNAERFFPFDPHISFVPSWIPHPLPTTSDAIRVKSPGYGSVRRIARPLLYAKEPLCTLPLARTAECYYWTRERWYF